MARNGSTADDILGRAQALIVEGGYNGFSYADIATEVGIRKPSIHHHFPSKAELVRTLVARYRKEAEAGIAEQERTVSDPLELLRNYTTYWDVCITNATAPFCVCALLASELPILPDGVAAEVVAHFRTLSAWLTSVIERGVQQNRLKVSATPRQEAEAFMATVHGAMLSARAYGDPKMFGAIIAPLLDRISVQD